MEAFGGCITKSSKLEWEECEVPQILTINSFILDRGSHARVLVEAEGIKGEVSCAILSSAQPQIQCSLTFPQEARFYLASGSDDQASVSILGTSNFCEDGCEGDHCCDGDDCEEDDEVESDNEDYDIPSLIMDDSESASTEDSDSDERTGPIVEEVFTTDLQKEEGSNSAVNGIVKAANASVDSTKSIDRKRTADTEPTTVNHNKKLKVVKESLDSTQSGQNKAVNTAANDKVSAVAPNVKKVFPNGLKFEITHAGTGKKCALKGRKITVAYSGSLASSGKQFDKGQLSFVVGAGEVVPGFDQGVEGMILGESRMCYIPSKLGYGKKGAPGVIPPNANLIFDIKLTKVW